MKSKNALHQETILVLVEFSRKTHIALNRAIIASRSKSIKPKLHICISVNENGAETNHNNNRPGQHDRCLKEITQSVEKEELDYTCEYCELAQRYASVLNCAERIRPDILMIPDYDENLKTSKGRHTNWTSSTQPHWPVMILSPSACSYSETGFEFDQAS